MTEAETQTKPGLWQLILRLQRDHRVRFLFVGGFNTLVGYIVFALLLAGYTHALEPQLPKAAVAEIAYLSTHVLTVLMAFFLYRRFVFRVRGNVLRDLARFESVYLVSLGINAIMLPILVGVLQLHALVAQAILTIIIALISYFGHRHFSFRRKQIQVAVETGAIHLPEKTHDA